MKDEIYNWLVRWVNHRGHFMPHIPNTCFIDKQRRGYVRNVHMQIMMRYYLPRDRSICTPPSYLLVYIAACYVQHVPLISLTSLNACAFVRCCVRRAGQCIRCSPSTAGGRS